MRSLWWVVAAGLGVCALCSLLEAMLGAARAEALEDARERGQHAARARELLRLKEQGEVASASLRLLASLAHSAGATAAGALAAGALGGHPLLFAAAAVALGALVLGELLPRAFGAARWERLWPALAVPTAVLCRLVWPLSALAAALTRAVAGAPSQPPEESGVASLIRSGSRAGTLSETAQQLLGAVFRFDATQVQEVMFPRRDVAFLDVGWDLERCREVVVRTQHTRYPLCDGSLDHLLGCVHVKDLLARGAERGVEVRALARPLRRVPDTMPVRRLLREMQRAQAQMVAVVDEHGTVVGFATFENLLEQLVGAVQDEFDREEPEIVAEGPGVHLVRGSVLVSRLNAELQQQLSDAEASTVSGLVVARLGRLPVPGDRVDLGPLHAEVLATEGHRAARLRVQLKNPEVTPA